MCLLSPALPPSPRLPLSLSLSLPPPPFSSSEKLRRIACPHQSSRNGQRNVRDGDWRGRERGTRQIILMDGHLSLVMSTLSAARGAFRPRPPCAPSVARTISPSLSSSFMGKCQCRCHRTPRRPPVYLRLSARNAASVTAVAVPHVECSRDRLVHRLLAHVMTSAQLCALGIPIFAANMSSLVAQYHPSCSFARVPFCKAQSRSICKALESSFLHGGIWIVGAVRLIRHGFYVAISLR